MRKKNGGFTLMELLIVVAIILVLTGAIVARMTITSASAKQAKAKAELDEIAAGCRACYMDTTLWPGAVLGIKDLLVVTPAPAQGFNESGTAVTLTATTWKGPYLEAADSPVDPWGASYILERVPDAAPFTLQAKSKGPSATDAADDIKVVVHRFGT